MYKNASAQGYEHCDKIIRRENCQMGKVYLEREGLTDKAINTLQNYYGMAIRQNKNDLYSMKKAVGQFYITAVIFPMKVSGISSVPKL